MLATMLFQRHMPTPTVDQALGWLESVRDADIRADPAHVLAAAEAALRLGEDRLGRAAAARLQALRSSALIELKRFDEAVEASALASQLGPLEPSVHFARAMSLFRTAAFDEAAAAARTLTAATPQDPRAWHLLGRIELWRQSPPTQADHAFARAAALAPRAFVVPHRVPAEEFDAIASDAVAAIPAPIAAMLDNVMIRAFPLPPRDDVRGGLPPDLLGLYTGATIAAAGVAMYPARVALYQLNIETFCGDAAALSAQVRRVVMHEVGHHFSMDHDDLRAAGL
jgi:predicted Zn-dependent protease with MMP-like domain